MASNAGCPAYRPAAWFVTIASVAAACSMLAGAAMLFGRYAAAWLPANLFPPQPGSGAAFFLAGLALWLRRVPPVAAPTAHGRRVLAAVAALAVVAPGVLMLAQYLFDLEPGLGRFPFAGPMAVLAASCFVLTGTGLLLLDYVSRGGYYPAEYCAIAIIGIMGIPVIGFLYGTDSSAQVAAVSAMPPQTAMLFTGLAAGMLAARPAHRLMLLWNSNAPGGHLLRLLPKSLLLLIALGLAVEWGARFGFYGKEHIFPFAILLGSGWLALLFWRAASLLNAENDVRLKGEAALFEASALLRAVSDNTPDAIFVKERGGRIVFANPATLRMFDKSAESVIGRHGSELYGNPADADMVDRNDRSVMAAGKAERVEETVDFSYGNRTFYTTRAPWLNDKGELLGLVGISTDVTDRKRIEDALKAHETQLEALVATRTAEVRELIGHLETTREEEKRAIARELHDDLGSALTALNMHLAILFQQMPPEPKMTERAVQIKALLSSVTQTTRRIQAGLRPDKLDIFGIKTAIAEQVTEFENYTGVSCHANLPDEELAYPPQLEIALFRMVQEALNNIAKHAGASRVDVVLDDTDESVILTIRDNGAGMAADLPSPATAHGLRGMRERAGYLGGDVSIISAPGNGTSIVVTVPKTIGHDAMPDGGATENKIQAAY